MRQAGPENVSLCHYCFYALREPVFFRLPHPYDAR